MVLTLFYRHGCGSGLHAAIRRDYFKTRSYGKIQGGIKGKPIFNMKIILRSTQ